MDVELPLLFMLFTNSFWYARLPDARVLGARARDVESVVVLPAHSLPPQLPRTSATFGSAGASYPWGIPGTTFNTCLARRGMQ